MDRIRKLLASLFYVGYIPGAPGTYASAVAALAYAFAGFPTGAWGWTALGGILIVSVISLWRAEEMFGARDPRQAVIDEVAGQWLTLLVAGAVAGRAVNWDWLGLAFILFRLYDIFKPWPINRLERLRGWAGILVDDLAAGAFAGAFVGVVMRLVLGVA